MSEEKWQGYVDGLFGYNDAHSPDAGVQAPAMIVGNLQTIAELLNEIRLELKAIREQGR